VASGDPLPDGVLLWTRVTPTPDALPGSGAGPEVGVTWEIAADPGFAAIVASGTARTGPERDHTVKVDAAGLAPSTVYYYRFRLGDAVSTVGTTRTAPATEAAVQRLRFGVVSCSNWEAGYFAAYRHLAARTDLFAVVHLGDYLYEYRRGEYGGRDGSVRWHEPAHEIVSLADYRIRHAQYKSDPDLAALHARLPFVCIWDDHETANDAWAGGAQNHNPATEGDWQTRRASGRRAYLEWMPVRAHADGRLYRRLRFGALAELSMLDLRSYRDAQVPLGPGSRRIDDPARTITGREQMDWLTAGLVTAPTRWKLVGNPVMIAPLVLPPLSPDAAAGVTQLIGIPAGGLPVNPDQWDGYTADRRRLLGSIADNRVDGVVFLTGDIHSSWAADLPLDAAAYPVGTTAGAEFVVPSVTSQSLAEITGAPPRTASVPVEGLFRETNRHLRYVELDSHGYGVLHLDPEQAQMDWFYATDVTDPRSTVRHGASLGVRHGGRLEPRPAPIV
jgi:alkaline phosphatase D